MPTGSSTSAPAPATTAAGSSSRAHLPTLSPPVPPSPASTSRPMSAPDRDPRGNREMRSVRPAEDEPLPVGGREIAPNAQPLLWRTVGRDAARGGRGLGLDVVLALGRATVEGQRPARLDRLGELFPRIHCARVGIAEFG